MTDQPDPRGSMSEARRPWGGFEQLTHNEPTTVKIITVEPGHRLSLQTHALRSECWQVLDGPLDVTIGDESWRAQPGERMWIPRGTKHRMGNPTGTPARILEIAYGDFDEGDITRHEDDYQR